jgi:hypothetical protein
MEPLERRSRRARSLSFLPQSPGAVWIWRGVAMARLSGMRIDVSQDSVEVRLALWQKALGLLGNIRAARADVSDAHVVEDPLPLARAAGVKVGLRLPGLYYVARTINLDQAFVVRRGVPALSFAVDDGGRLHTVLLSTPRAEELARELQGR